MTEYLCRDCGRFFPPENIERCQCDEMICKWCQGSHGTQPCTADRDLRNMRDIVADLLASELPMNPDALKPGQWQSRVDAVRRAEHAMKHGTRPCTSTEVAADRSPPNPTGSTPIGNPSRSRKAGYLYVLLASNLHSPEERFVEVEDCNGSGSRAVRSFLDGPYRLLEFPHPELRELLKACYLLIDKHIGDEYLRLVVGRKIDDADDPETLHACELILKHKPAEKGGGA
ncbi:MAG: hypothetical protein GY719_31605 [bacterium]|nr:hypothetical protein [bacterium]